MRQRSGKIVFIGENHSDQLLGVWLRVQGSIESALTALASATSLLFSL